MNDLIKAIEECVADCRRIQKEGADEVLRVQNAKPGEVALMVLTYLDNEFTRAQRALLNATQIELGGPEAEKDVHTDHCCIVHGCKYGDASCPVETGQKKQSYLCAVCTDHDTEAEKIRDRFMAEHRAWATLRRYLGDAKAQHQPPERLVERVIDMVKFYSSATSQEAAAKHKLLSEAQENTKALERIRRFLGPDADRLSPTAVADAMCSFARTVQNQRDDLQKQVLLK